MLIEWESGERTWELIKEIFRVHQYFLADYAKEHNLLDEWNSKAVPVKKLAKRNKLLTQILNKAKMKSYKNATVYMFGHEVPRNHAQAMEIDRKMEIQSGLIRKRQRETNCSNTRCLMIEATIPVMHDQQERKIQTLSSSRWPSDQNTLVLYHY